MAKENSSSIITTATSSSMAPLSSAATEDHAPFKPHKRIHVRGATADAGRRSVGEPEDINESADAFIRRFKHHLQLQRLQSIENYKEMLARGL